MTISKVATRTLQRFALLAACLLAIGCERGSTAPAGDSKPAASAAAPAAASAADSSMPAGNLLRMRIDGSEWTADREHFGAVHPTGYDRAVLIAGSLGPKDANEQAFNIVLLKVDAPGTYRVNTGNPSLHVAQIANLTPERYLAGNLFGYDLEVELLEMRAAPVRIEARFKGTLNASDGSVLTISDGEFRYAE